MQKSVSQSRSNPPRVSTVIPKNNSKKITFDSELAIKKLKKISKVNKTSNHGKLTFANGVASVDTSDINFSTKAKVEFDCVGDNFECGINIGLLQKALETVGDFELFAEGKLQAMLLRGDIISVIVVPVVLH